MIEQFPHCDARTLHAPEDGCEFCNRHPDWQALREAWGISFTSHSPPDDSWLPDPADYNRPEGSPADHRQWPGNRPTGWNDHKIHRPKWIKLLGDRLWLKR